jgi:hypothetical protein
LNATSGCPTSWIRSSQTASEAEVPSPADSARSRLVRHGHEAAYIEGWDEAVDLVIEYLDQIKAGTAPQYVAVDQYNNHEHWMRVEGTYSDGRLTVRNLPPNMVCTVHGCENRSKHLNTPCPEHGGERFYQPGDRQCRLKRCGDVALPGSPRCARHAPIFIERERERQASYERDRLAKERRQQEREAKRAEREEKRRGIEPRRLERERRKSG